MDSSVESNNLTSGESVTPLRAALQKTVDNPPTPDFSNWLHQKGPMSEYMTSLYSLQENGANPGLVRYLMQYSYQSGFADGHSSAEEVKVGCPGKGTEPAVVAGPEKTSLALGTAAGSTLPELWVCNACDHVGDPEEWDRDTRPATYRDPAEHHDTCPHCGARNENEEFTFEWYFTELKRKEPKGEPMNSTQTRYVVEALNGE